MHLGTVSTHRLSSCKITRRFAILIYFPFLFLNLPAQQTKYTSKLYTIEDGLSHNSVLWIEKDRYGFIWTRSYIGISRFDGTRFTSYLTDFLRDFVDRTGQMEIVCNSKGELWFINKWGPAVRHDYRHDSFRRLYDISPGKGGHQTPFWERSGKLWVYTKSALYRMSEASNDSVYIASEFHLEKEIGEILDMNEFPEGYLWVGTTTGLYYMKESSNSIELTRYDLKIQNLDLEPERFNWPAWIIPWEDKLWISTNGKILLADLPVSRDKDDDHSIPCELIILDRPDIELGRDHTVFTIAWDGVRNLYFRTIKGVYGYSVETKEIERIYAEDYELFDYAEGTFHYAMKYDPDGILWVGTDQGLLKITIGNKNFHVIQPDPLNPDGLNYPRLNAVLVDRYNHLWVGTSGDGLYRSIPDQEGKYHYFEHYLPDADDPYSLRSKQIHRLLEDSRGMIWLTGEYTQTIELSGATPRFLDTPFPSCDGAINEDPQGNILEPSWSIGWVLHPHTGKVYQLYHDKNTSDNRNFEFCIASDSSCYLLASNRLYQLDGPLLFSEGSGDDSIPYAYPESSTLLLEDSAISEGKQFLVTVHEDYKEIWLQAGVYATLRRYRLPDTNAGKGVGNHSSPGKLELVNEYNIENGLSDNWIYEMIEDRNKRIWVTTQNGLTCIDPATENIYRYYEEDGLPTNKFYWSSCQDRNGSIYLCTVNGLVYFHPDSIVQDPPPPVYITGLRINNQPVYSGDDSPLEKEIMHTDRVSLPYNQNFLSFDFTALDFTNTDQVKYQYKMEGLDREWVEAGSRRQADYTDMRSGRYTFRVIASNSNGVWNREGASVEVFIARPFWFRWWFVILAGMLLMGIIIAIIRFRERNLKQQARLLAQKVDEKTNQIIVQRKEVDDMKSRFYANISHEFRTPLTLLISPIEDAMKQGQERIEVSKRIISIMHRNARRLQNLINQLLDISRIESGKMELQLNRANLSDFVRVVAISFYSLAESRHIQYQITIEPYGEDSCFDADKTEKIIMNLLSNAFKFSEDGGCVSLKLEFVSPVNENHRQAVVRVKDNGKGMKQDHLEKIFDRFYQVSDHDTREVEGSGVGLALTRELLELMHGSIEVESTPGKGTTFIVTFPVSEGSFSEQEIETMNVGESLVKDATGDEIEQLIPPESVAEIQGEEMVLVVEDNPDLRSYIIEKFSRHYKVIEAENGETGLRKAIEQIPDLVITDLMMPVMGGVEFCRKLKEHPAINHIPVIMLTAKADKDSRIEGLEAAADDYISKPFDSDLLLARVRNLISQRNELRKHFEKELIFSGDEDHAASPKFSKLREIVKMIEAHLDDSNFELDSMASLLHMSRRGLFRKIKAVTGMTPHEFVHIMRMKRAAALLRKGELNVTEVMYQVGMKNLSHFARSFRKYYGVNPGEYRKRETG